MKFFIVTYSIVAVTVAIAMTVDNLGLVVALIGAGNSTCTVYIMPGFLYYYRVPNKNTKCSKCMKVFAFAWGVAGCFFLPFFLGIQFVP